MTASGPVDTSGPEAPSAQVFRTLSPGLRDAMLPPPELFSPRQWVERIVCGSGDLPGWRRTKKERLVESYEVECPGEAALPIVLDASNAAPPPAGPLRLLPARSFADYAAALKHLEQKSFTEALRALELAAAASPEEPVYRRERIYVLYLLARHGEALVEADELLRSQRSPLLYKYRALAARELGRRSEVLRSLDGMLSSCTPSHPLYAEAVCAKGLLLANDGNAEGERLVRRGCELDYKPCCEAAAALEAHAAEARRAAKAARPRRMDLPTPSSPSPDALQTLPPDEPALDPPRPAQEP